MLWSTPPRGWENRPPPIHGSVKSRRSVAARRLRKLHSTEYMPSDDDAAASRSEAARNVTRPLESASKQAKSGCDELGKASIKCIEDHDYVRNHPECQRHYDAYKQCRKEETQLKRQGTKKPFFG